MKKHAKQLGQRAIVIAAALTLAIAPSTAANAHRPHDAPTATLLASGLAAGTGSGSAIGPDGALYVTEGAAGRVSRIDRRTGAITTFAEGLPSAVVPIGGPMDVEFIHGEAYVLVTLVGPSVGGTDIVGIYRVDGPSSFTVVADLGAWSSANPPTNNTDYFVPDGVPYALQRFGDGFLVTDGHHGRVLRVGLDGSIAELISWPDIVPTGLDIRGNRIWVAQAGPVPHLPNDGKIVTLTASRPVEREVASGVRLAVDVELGRHGTLYALSQGVFTPGNPEGSPAEPDTGSLMRVGHRGDLQLVTDGLDRPTTLEIVGDTAYVVTLGGEVWKIEHLMCRPRGRDR